MKDRGRGLIFEKLQGKEIFRLAQNDVVILPSPMGEGHRERVDFKKIAERRDFSLSSSG